jgi:hypothetical protein
VDQLISSFEDLARRYCKLLENQGPIEAPVFARKCLILLLRLYEGAMLLPEAETSEDDAPRIDYETSKAMFDSIAARMPGRDSYWTVFEPLDLEPPSPVVGSVADDIADIWRDLNPGLLLIDSGRPNSRNGAVWAWRFGFNSHWGRHAVEAITVLHALCIDDNSRIDAI